MSDKSAKRRNGDENCRKHKKSGFVAEMQNGKSIENAGALRGKFFDMEDDYKTAGEKVRNNRLLLFFYRFLE